MRVETQESDSEIQLFHLCKQKMIMFGDRNASKRSHRAHAEMEMRRMMKVVYRTFFIQKMVCMTQHAAVPRKGITGSGYRNVNEQLRPECGHKDS